MKQILIGGYNNALNNAADENNLVGGGGLSWADIGWTRSHHAPCAGTFSRLSVETDGVPGTNPYVITFRINNADTPVTVTIPAAGLTDIDLANEIVIARGDYFNIRSTRPGGNPDNTPIARWSIQFEGAVANQGMCCSVAACNNGANRYASLQNTGGNMATANNAKHIMPTAGVIRDLGVWLNVSPGVGPEGYSFTLYKNNIAQALTATVTAPATDAGDIVNSVAFVAGDSIYWEIVPLNAPTNSPSAHISCVWEPTIDGESIYTNGTVLVPSTAATNYVYPYAQTTEAFGAVEAGFFYGAQAPAEDMVLKKFFAEVFNAPGAGNHWDFSLRGGGGDTGITLEIADANKTGNDVVNTYNCVAYDDICFRSIPDSGPAAAGWLWWGFVGYMAPAGGVVTPKGNIVSKLIAARLIR